MWLFKEKYIENRVDVNVLNSTIKYLGLVGEVV